MITFKECLSKSNWVDISLALTRLFPSYAEMTDSFHSAYEELRQLNPLSNQMRITIGRYDPHSILPFYVVGFNGDCPKGIGVKFLPWEKWLAAHIDASLFNQFQISEILAICLQDMCWAGFSSEEVRAFRQEFINHEECLWAVYAHEEDIKASETNLVKQKQRENEFNESLNLHDIDFDEFDRGLIFEPQSVEYRKARFDLGVQIYCLGESETDYEEYTAKVNALREDFHLRWPNPSSNSANIH